MTRREEIVNNIGYQTTKAAMEYYQANCTKDVDLSDAFEEGAEWMQKTMIEKACEYLTAYHPHFAEHFLEDFRNAMEE
jgi:hypothetical protein